LAWRTPSYGAKTVFRQQSSPFIKTTGKNMNKEYVATSSPMDNLGYFIEWGAKSWANLTYHAIHTCVGEEQIVNKEVLEIGARYGKISSLFGLLGAKVTGIDINKECLITAKKEAVKHGVCDRVKFLAYDGNLDVFPDESFDIIFTKSVLVLVPELDSFLITLNRKLKPNGKVIFIENGYGNMFIHFLRKFRHRKWAFSKAKFFKSDDMKLLRRSFHVMEIKRSWIPPIWMIYGEKKVTT
jgi:2-polyprenyl-3-methyl-5-hydroxy-6-metoxy-1,4-benzoquinol methylase